MSTKISAKCWDITNISPTQKLVLISLADQANDEGVCWPSIHSIRNRTGLSDRAIQKALKWLESKNLVLRHLRYKKSTVYEVIPDNWEGVFSGEYHYVYRITHKPTGNYYIGLRTSGVPPEDDDYFGSGVRSKWLIEHKDECHKDIVSVFSTRSDAAEFEYMEISSSINDYKCLNKRANSPSQDGGMPHIDERNSPEHSSPEPRSPEPRSPVPRTTFTGTPNHVRKYPEPRSPRTIKEPSLEPSKEPSKETEAAKIVLEYLNDKTGKRFKPTDPNLRFIRGRLAEGHSPNELMAVVDRKIPEWTGTKMEQYLRPATLFGAEKCNQYVGELSRPSEEQESDKRFREWLGEGVSDERIIDGEVLR